MQFEFDPPLPPPSKSQPESFGQSIRLTDGGRVLATGRWVASATSVGTVQLLELHVDPQYRRSGHGRRMMRQIVDQAGRFHADRQTHLRRIWIGVGHMSQVVGRSFLTGEGFHHVGSAGGLFGDEDLLVYVKAYR